MALSTKQPHRNPSDSRPCPVQAASVPLLCIPTAQLQPCFIFIFPSPSTAVPGQRKGGTFPWGRSRAGQSGWPQYGCQPPVPSHPNPSWGAAPAECSQLALRAIHTSPCSFPAWQCVTSAGAGAHLSPVAVFKHFSPSFPLPPLPSAADPSRHRASTPCSAGEDGAMLPLDPANLQQGQMQWEFTAHPCTCLCVCVHAQVCSWPQ